APLRTGRERARKTCRRAATRDVDTRNARHIVHLCSGLGKRFRLVRPTSKSKLLLVMRFASTVFLVTWMSAAWQVVGADNPLVLEIWPGKVPDESGDI